MRLLAQTLSLPWGDSTTNITGIENFKFNTLGELLFGVPGQASVVNYVFAFAGIGLLLMLISSGFTFLTSGGDAKKLEQGKGRLTYALVGFLVIFAAYWLVQILGKIFGIEEINKTFL